MPFLSQTVGVDTFTQVIVAAVLLFGLPFHMPVATSPNFQVICAAEPPILRFRVERERSEEKTLGSFKNRFSVILFKRDILENVLGFERSCNRLRQASSGTLLPMPAVATTAGTSSLYARWLISAFLERRISLRSNLGKKRDSRWN